MHVMLIVFTLKERSFSVQRNPDKLWIRKQLPFNSWVTFWIVLSGPSANLPHCSPGDVLIMKSEISLICNKWSLKCKNPVCLCCFCVVNIFIIGLSSLHISSSFCSMKVQNVTWEYFLKASLPWVTRGYSPNWVVRMDLKSPLMIYQGS